MERALDGPRFWWNALWMKHCVSAHTSEREPPWGCAAQRFRKPQGARAGREGAAPGTPSLLPQVACGFGCALRRTPRAAWSARVTKLSARRAATTSRIFDDRAASLTAPGRFDSLTP